MIQRRGGDETQEKREREMAKKCSFYRAQWKRRVTNSESIRGVGAQGYSLARPAFLLFVLNVKINFYYALKDSHYDNLP